VGRLTDYGITGEAICNNVDIGGCPKGINDCIECARFREILNKLAAYEDNEDEDD
jgi:hypothetical protein